MTEYLRMTIAHDRATVLIGAQSQHRTLPPVTVALSSGPGSFQANLTPAEARQMAELLVDAADEAGLAREEVAA